MPGSLISADLPIALTYPGTVVWKTQAIGYRRSEVDWLLRVYVRAIGTGKGIDEGFQETIPLIDSVGQTIWANLTLDDTVDQILENTIQCSGVMVIPFAGVEFHAFEYRFTTVEKTEV
jgi:hypothetical protein